MSKEKEVLFDPNDAVVAEIRKRLEESPEYRAAYRKAEKEVLESVMTVDENGNVIFVKPDISEE